MRYDIFNPTTAPRVIYDGIDGQQRKITVLPNETKREVELADHIASGFHYAPTEDIGDLVLTPLDEPQEPPAPKALPADYTRYEAPPFTPQPQRPRKSKAAPLPLGE